MAKKKLVATKEILDANPELREAGVKEGTEAVDCTAAIVTWHGNSRTYSLAVHGENFLGMAKEFSEKKNGKITFDVA